MRSYRAEHSTTAPQLSTLTPQEIRVALAIADGLSNREAASALFVSPKTIETHLSHTFQKLNIKFTSTLNSSEW